jgi:hypothetical protein
MMTSLVDELEREVAHSDFMKAMAQHWMQRAQDAERTLAIVIHAAGGKVVVYSDHLHDARKLEMIRFKQAHDMTTHFIVRSQTPSSKGE